MSTAVPEPPLAEAPAAGDFDPSALFPGVLHIYVAFDWGDEIDLPLARRLVPAQVSDLPRRRRTPSSIAYRPPPLRFQLEPVALELAEVGPVRPLPEATVFDFGAVSVNVQVPFRLPAAGLSRLAGWLADPAPFIAAARSALEGLYRQLLPAVQGALWREDLSEEYFVFQLLPAGCPAAAATLLRSHAGWLAGLVRLESGPLSNEEIAEALRLHLSYSPDDLFVPDWAAAVLLDQDCGETLQAVEFANLQLLEYRHIDDRLDDSLAGAYRLIHPLTHTWLPFWRNYGRPLRQLGELKVEANGLFERTGNVLKLVGDQYLARVYRLVAGRFHLEEWEQNIQRKLEVAEGVYQVVSDQAVTGRTEFLELVVIFLILLEVLLAVFHH
jgi:hypothetical protein